MNRRGFLCSLPAVAVLIPKMTETVITHIDKENKVVTLGRELRIPLELRPGGKLGHFDPEGGSLGPGSNYYIKDLQVPEGW